MSSLKQTVLYYFNGDNMDYVDRLTQLRQDRDISQKEIAKILNCQQSAISKYELRRADYKVNDIITLCNYYNVSADYVLGLKSNMPFPTR